MKASVHWQHEGLLFAGTADSGFTIQFGSNDVGEKQGLSPMELLLVSLAGCTAMDVISILAKQRQDVTDFQVRVEGERATEHPKVYTHLRVHYLIRGRDIDPAAVERAVTLSQEKYCSVSAMLGQVAVLEHRYEIAAA
ncbi:MAG: OsmC family protein [Anaerolineae bacterium]|nr:OsmC family protein [Anaerolineae bacterium]